LLAGVALYFLYSNRFFDARDDFSTRLGNTVARTSGSIEGILGNQNLDRDAKSHVTNQLLQLLLGNQSIKCAKLSGDGIEVPNLSAPSEIGCRFAQIDDWLEVAFDANEQTVLRVGFSTEQVTQIRQFQIRNSLSVLGFSLVASVLSSWFAFRVIVGRPLKALIDDIVRSRDLAEHANATKTRFLANMSHELRTPLNGVLGNAEFLRETSLTSSQRECVNTITKSGNALKLIIEDVLDFAQIDATAIKLNNDEFDLSDLIFDAVSMIEIDAAGKGIELLVDCPTHLEYNLIGDGARFRQVLLNLLSNAIKFTNEGTVTLEVKLVLKGSEAEVCCSVTDTGVGISADALETIFKPFSQVNESTTRKYGGTGLGLTISRELVRMMGGELTASSSLGDGSKFTCRVPFQYGQISELPEEYSALKSLTEKRHFKVLLVANCQLSTAIASKYLSRLGVQHDTAIWCEKAPPMLEAAAASEKPYDVLLLASQMPNLRNGSLIDKLCSDPLIEKTSVILMGGMRIDIQEHLASNKIQMYTVPTPLRPKMLARALYETLIDHRETKHVNDGAKLSPEQKVFDGVRFLLVDDHVVNLRVLEQQLQSTGAILRVANDGSEAVEVFTNYKPEVVMMDISMPNMDGFEATKRIRKLESESGIAPSLIIAVSGNVLKEFKDNAKAVGMDGFIEKPADRESLILTISSKMKPSEESYPSENLVEKESSEKDGCGPIESENISLIDMERLGPLRSMFKADDFSRLLETFIKNGDVIIDEIERYVGEGSYLEAATSAHRLKGSSANIGCVGISRAMAELEQTIKVRSEVSLEEVALVTVLWSDTKTALIATIHRD